MKVSEDIRYIGVNDRDIDLFEGMYDVPNGMAYNSYIITDEKTAVMDTVDAAMGTEWLEKLDKALGGRKPDYLIVSHMEPDHSANIVSFKEKYPETVVVASSKAFTMMKNFFGTEFEDSRIVVGEGDKLELGKHTLEFITAPMVHWPEVIMTYDSHDKVLFTADAFGKFGTLDTDEDWACEARRYYFGIVGKYGAQVQAVLKKIAGCEIAAICPLHGPVLDKDISYYIDKYNVWSSYEPEDKGITIACASIHGNTAAAAKKFKEILESKGAEKVSIFDLSRDDMAEAIEDAFRYDRLVLMSASYDAGVFPPMLAFAHKLVAKGYKNRKIAIVENGSWAPSAARTLRPIVDQLKDVTLVEPIVTIKSSLKDADLPKLEALADELVK